MLGPLYRDAPCYQWPAVYLLSRIARLPSRGDDPRQYLHPCCVWAEAAAAGPDAVYLLMCYTLFFASFSIKCLKLDNSSVGADNDLLACFIDAQEHSTVQSRFQLLLLAGPDA